MEGLKNALEYIASLGVRASMPAVVSIDGKKYCNMDLKRYDAAPKARAIEATTLTALMDYIRDAREELHEKMIIQVMSPKEVRLYSGLLDEREREILFVAECMTPEFIYGREYDQKEFMIKIQSCFAKNRDDDQENIQYLAGNIDSSQEAQFSDNGTMQTCVVKTGVATKENYMVPNPVTLTPFRTFSEVEQPASEFVFRVEQKNGAPAFKLVEADGGRWKNEAMHRIKAYIMQELQKTPVEGVQFTVIA